jgi:hypothetical protein
MGGGEDIYVNIDINSWIDVDPVTPAGRIYFRSPSNSFFLRNFDLKLNIRDAKNR